MRTESEQAIRKSERPRVRRGCGGPTCCPVRPLRHCTDGSHAQLTPLAAVWSLAKTRPGVSAYETPSSSPPPHATAGGPKLGWRPEKENLQQ